MAATSRLLLPFVLDTFNSSLRGSVFSHTTPAPSGLGQAVRPPMLCLAFAAVQGTAVSMTLQLGCHGRQANLLEDFIASHFPFPFCNSCSNPLNFDFEIKMNIKTDLTICHI